MMWTAIFSNFFRLCCYIYLQVIPTSLGKFVLPISYLAHLATAGGLLIPEPEVEKEPKPQEPERHPALSVLGSLPSRSKKARTANLVINALGFLACLEFTLTPFIDSASGVVFTRIGAVYPDSVKIVARYPQANATEHDIRVLWRAVSTVQNVTQPWRDGPLLKLKADADWVGTAKLGGLWPTTLYEYALSSPNRTLLPYPARPLSFETFPDPRLPIGTHFSFVASSCIIPNFPYNGPFSSRKIKGFDLFSKYMTTNNVKFMLFLGDFVYADVPVYIGNTISSYRRAYRRIYQSSSFRKVYEKLPVFHTYDDHEFVNNYIGYGNDSQAPFPAASDAFNLYHANSNYDSIHADQQYYKFLYGDSAFFVMDTRRHRFPNAEDASLSTMLGDAQLAALHAWLTKVNSTSTFKFIVSSVPFTSLWTHESYDTWAGYAHEKAQLLAAIQTVPNVIIISGDRHSSAAIEFNGGANRVLEFSTSPLSMFYIPWDRSLKRQSVETVQVESESGLTTLPKEKVLHSLRNGNYKWSSIEVDTRDRSRPVVIVDVMNNGKLGYRYEILGTPVKLQTTTAALGAYVSTGVKDILDRIGMTNRWF